MSDKKNKKDQPSFDEIDKIIDNTFARLKDLVDANTMVGSTIKLTERLFIIPISRVSVGLVSGGGEVPASKKNNMSISAGSTTGFSLTPIGFITINDNVIDFIGTTTIENSTSRLLDVFMGIYEKILTKSETKYEEE